MRPRNMLSDELLMACGLLQQHGKLLRLCRNEWEKLQTEFRLDIDESASTNTKEYGASTTLDS
jgi:hypothetical protein